MKLKKKMNRFDQIIFDLIRFGYRTRREWGLVKDTDSVKPWALSFLAVNKHANTTMVDYYPEEGPPKQVDLSVVILNEELQPLQKMKGCFLLINFFCCFSDIIFTDLHWKF